MPTFQEILSINEQYAADNAKEPSAIKRLLMYHSHMEPHLFYTQLKERMNEDDYQAFLKDVDCYIKHHKPIQHLIGSEDFFGYTFKVNGDVLIPRFETEELVAYVLDYMDAYFPHHETIHVLDVGTGSGCIGLTLAKENPRCQVTATDISGNALKVARENAQALGVQVRFLEGDLYQPIQGERFDIIVSNPPYIPNTEEVLPVVRDHEPHVALFGGVTGLEYYERLIGEASQYLKPHAMMAFEHAFDKAKALRKLIKKALPHQRVEQKKDMQHKDRMTFVFIES